MMNGNETKQSESQILVAALALAAQGFRILPVCPAQTGCGSRTCKQGKHPLPKKWVAAASSDTEQIRAWFKKWPNAGIGICTGSESGVFVIDTDREQGQQSLELLMKEHNWQPNTLTAITGRGKHLYFKHPGTVKVITRTGIAPGVDCRGDGGFVVAPPSQHVSGATYTWDDPNCPIAEVPGWLIKLVSESKPKVKVIRDPKCDNPNVEDLIINKGDRHDYLMSTAGRLRASGMDKDGILENLSAINRDACKPSLSDAEVSKIAASVSKYEAGRTKRSYAARQAARENALPYFPLYTNDWLADRDLLFMDSEQRGWYFMLAFESWRSGGILEDEPDKLWKLARAESREAFEQKQDAVLTKFDAATDEDGRPILVHRTMATLWKRQIKTWRAKVAAGKASAEKRAVEKETEAVAA